MTNRKLIYIIKDQRPLVLYQRDTVQHACRLMSERCTGSVLVVDDQQCLCGIFTGRDAVRVLARGDNAALTILAKSMTSDPVTITPDSRAIDALRLMSNGGFRHLPVVEGGIIWGLFLAATSKEWSWTGLRKKSIFGNVSADPLYARPTLRTLDAYSGR
jgi:CBS domain-containing protein